MQKDLWYQEQWVWFILLLLGAAIAGAVAMSVIAIKNSPAEIDSHWYQDGALTKQKRQQVKFIKNLHLYADLQVQQGDVNCQIRHDDAKLTREQTEILDAAELWLYIEHPIKPSLDQKVQLRRIAKQRYQGKLASPLSGKRHLLLSPTSELWYLTSQAYFPTRKIKFQPDVG